ncbi:MAG TPA: hypothetical protein VLE89_04720 [Chlamydiales bacterium]|nr:hypothetical protein [Chlamydiales bacterium]
MVAVKILDSVQSFAELSPIIEKSTQNYSFWGWRHIRVNVHGKEGKLSLQKLTKCLESLVEKNPDFSMAERAHGKAIRVKIRTFEIEKVDLLKQKNILTRIFYKLRDFFWKHCCCCSNERYNELYQHESPLAAAFGYFTRKQFQEEYHCTLEESKKRGDILEHSWGGPYWRIKEKGNGCFRYKGPPARCVQV